MYCDDFVSTNPPYAPIGSDQWSPLDQFIGGQFAYDHTMNLQLPEDLYDAGWDGQALMLILFPDSFSTNHEAPLPLPRSGDEATCQPIDARQKEWHAVHYRPQNAHPSSSRTQARAQTRASSTQRSMPKRPNSVGSRNSSISASSAGSPIQQKQQQQQPPAATRPKRRSGGDGAALRCPHQSCNSTAVFRRQCDLDKHYRLHFRHYFCRVPGCAQADSKTSLGYSTAKDRNRHESSHNPSLTCEHCTRVFSRMDNLRDHCRRLHRAA
ncbi:hypothetical protein PWT90_03394 [Aphanocladium album]|nr:hypothetical protein PWT90_03394 [Aphanocladium album]